MKPQFAHACTNHTWEVCFAFKSLILRVIPAQTNRFIWLDGSQWKYEDWLPGEPSRTSSLENCVELLPYSKSQSFHFKITLNKLWIAEPHAPGFLICRLFWLSGNGKFNDFTCWEPQAFICSYPYHWTCKRARLQPVAPSDALLRSMFLPPRL